MSLHNLCPDCKEGYLVEEIMGAEETKTCTNCGYSTESTNIVMPTSFQGGFGLSMEGSFEQKYSCKVKSSYKQTSESNKIVLNKLKNYLQRYANHDDLYESVSTMYLQALKERKFKNCNMRMKHTVVVACLVIVLRNAGISVLIPKLCEDFEINVKRVMQTVGQLKPKADDAKEADIQTFVDNLFERNKYLKERASLKSHTLKLIELFYELHLHTTRPVLASVALYYALLSESDSSKPLMTVKEFCSIHNVDSKPSLHKCASSAKTKLYLLAKRLPWAPTSITKSNCHHFIKDVLKAKNSLSGADFGLDSHIPLEKNVYKRKLVTPTDDRDDALKSNKVTITEQNVIELPPVSIKNFGKVPKVDEKEEPIDVPTSEIIDENEMTESELKDYIRSPEEIEVARKIWDMVNKT